MPFASTAPLRREIATRIPDRPFTVEFWDGTRLPATAGEGPTFTVRSPRAAAHALRAPGQLGLGRAYVSGELEVDDIDAVIAPARQLAAALARRRRQARPAARRGPRRRDRRRRRRAPPPSFVPSGRRHSKERDARAVRHHYDVSNEFFALFLDESMTYSCANCFAAGRQTLEEAQEAKLDMVATKLALQPGERVLDVGCGWGSFVDPRGTGIRRRTWSASPSRSRRPRRRGGAPRRRASATGSRSA